MLGTSKDLPLRTSCVMSADTMSSICMRRSIEIEARLGTLMKTARPTARTIKSCSETEPNRFLDLKLGVVERTVHATAGHQLRMTAFFDKAAAIEDENTIHMAQRREPVRNDEGRSSPRQLLQGLPNLDLGFGIDVGRGLVEDDDWWIFQEDSGDRDALLLPDGKFHASLADPGFVLLGQFRNELMRAGDPRHLLNFRLARREIPIGDVFSHSAVKQKRFLLDKPHLLSNICKR